MKARLYIKPNIVGLQFETPHSRDLFLLSLKHKKVDACAESFGEKSIRFNAAKATTTMDVSVDVGLHENGVVKVYVEEKNGAAKENPVAVEVVTAPKPPEQTISAANIRPPDPISAVGTLPPEITGETAMVVQTPVEVIPAPPAPVMLKVPEISGITVDEAASAPLDTAASMSTTANLAAIDPEPVGVHKNSRAYREWKARQPA